MNLNIFLLVHHLEKQVIMYYNLIQVYTYLFSCGYIFKGVYNKTIGFATLNILSLKCDETISTVCSEMTIEKRLSKMLLATMNWNKKNIAIKSGDRNHDRHVLSIVLCTILTSTCKHICCVYNITSSVINHVMQEEDNSEDKNDQTHSLHSLVHHIDSKLQSPISWST